MKTIVVVDDEVDIAVTVAEFLELSGYRVVVAHDGEDGLNKAIECEPDLVITDLMMPRMDGDELVTALREHAATKAIPVIMMSATRRLFVAPFLRKPFQPEQLLEAIATALGDSQR